jgi:hypothetical protein
MVGVSTAQNLINVIPAITIGGISDFCFVETEYAKQKQWSDGSIEVLTHRGINCTRTIAIENENNSDVAHITQSILAFCKDYPSVIFNFGGGQKAQSTAIWEAFKARDSEHDYACYTDQTIKKITIFKHDTEHNKSSQYDVDINTDISAYEIFKIHGFHIEGKGKVFYTAQQISNATATTRPHLLDFAEFREYVSQCYVNSTHIASKKFTIDEISKRFAGEKIPAFKALIESKITSLKKVDEHKVQIAAKQYEDQFYQCIFRTIKETLLSHNYVTDESFAFTDEHLVAMLGSVHLCNIATMVKLLGNDNIGTYFEKVLIQAITNLLLTNTHSVRYAYSNIKISKGNDKAEYDIVLVTQHGTLIVLDAKTGDFEKKDEDARKFNLLNSSGIYANFIPVYLFYPEDIGKAFAQKSIIAKIKEANLYKKQFFTFNNLREQHQIDIEHNACILNPIAQLLSILKL